jgi:putative ABC transport system ATP-binding protein
MLKITNLIKSFQNGQTETQILKGINFEAKDGEFISIMGRSGAGKSTFMYQMSLLDEPTSGEIYIDGQEVQSMSEKAKALFRLSKFGYVFQDYALLPEMTAVQNVALPLLMENFASKEATTLATEALTKVGLGKKINSLPSQLSGGEQQRVSISRAIAHRPQILFADEPTANLDRESSVVVMNIFKELHAQGQTIIMVTHEEEYGKMADRIVRLDDGMIVEEK